MNFKGVFSFHPWRRYRREYPTSKTYYALVGNTLWYAHIPGPHSVVGSPAYEAEKAAALRALKKQVANKSK